MMTVSKTYIVSVDISEEDEATIAVAEHEFGKVIRIIKTMQGSEGMAFYESMVSPSKVRSYASKDDLQASKKVFATEEHPRKQFNCMNLSIHKEMNVPDKMPSEIAEYIKLGEALNDGVQLGLDKVSKKEEL